MRTIILVRHGESEHHLRNLTGGWTDLPLTEQGQLQADLAARRVQQWVAGRKAIIYCSDLLRARQTAEPFSAIWCLKPILMSELRELNNGQAAYCTREQAYKMSKPLTTPALDWQHYPAGETWRKFYQRVSLAMETIFSSDSDVSIVICHKGTIVAIVGWWLHMDSALLQDWRFSCEAAPGSITVLKYSKRQEYCIDTLNYTAHLGFTSNK